MQGLKGMAAAAILGFLLGGCATVEIRETRVVMGRVTDESGQPVANSPVLVVGRSLDLATMRMQYEERGRREVRGTTEAEGRYRLEFVPASLGNNLFLFFYDQTGFDRVKYRSPEPLDITALLKGGREVTINQALRFAPGWPEVSRQIAYYGPESEKGLILRRHGLPEKREESWTGNVDSEVWWYYANGVSYWFAGGKLVRTHEFQPIPSTIPPK